jgi:hypothetical protein
MAKGFRCAKRTIFVELALKLAKPNGIPGQDRLIRFAGSKGIQIRLQELGWVAIKAIDPPICLPLNLDDAAFLKVGKVL